MIRSGLEVDLDWIRRMPSVDTGSQMQPKTLVQPAIILIGMTQAATVRLNVAIFKGKKKLSVDVDNYFHK